MYYCNAVLYGTSETFSYSTVDGPEQASTFLTFTTDSVYNTLDMDLYVMFNVQNIMDNRTNISFTENFQKDRRHCLFTIRQDSATNCRGPAEETV